MDLNCNSADDSMCNQPLMDCLYYEDIFTCEEILVTNFSIKLYR